MVVQNDVVESRRGAAVWRFCAAGLLVATLGTDLAMAGGGGPSPEPAGPCVDPALMAELRDRVEAHWAKFPPVSSPVDGSGPIYSFYPMGGTPWGDLFTGNFNDLAHPAGCSGCPDGDVLDWDCSDWTYDGHDATDTGIRSFGEQEIGVPVFAPRDGVVIDAHDGEDDMNTQALGQPANYCVIDHGQGIVAYYFHFKKDSVLVAAGDRVVAGQQLALTGSSGNSTGPHLHFATYRFGERFEPFAGVCRPGTSGWWDQFEIPRDFAIHDAGVSTEDIATAPLPPHALPRTGQVPFDAPVRQVWIMVRNVPANATWTLRTIRPDGTQAATFDAAFGHPAFRGGWYWFGMPNHSDLSSIVGEWEVRIELDGDLVQVLPFEVTSTFDPSFNHVPEPIVAFFDPPVPQAGEPVICRIDTSLALDDLDYEILSYRYRWLVDGVEVRNVVVAGHADMIDRTKVSVGSMVTCEVTPLDAVSSGPTATVVEVVGGSLDCNGNGIADGSDIGSGNSADGNGNGVPDECEAPVLFVDAATQGLELGTSWLHAYPDLQTALRVARSAGDGGPTEIWVAAGTYRPDEGVGDRFRSFDLVGGVAVLGGFAGDESDAADRDPAAHPTVLSGDLAGDDGPDFVGREDNAVSVVRVCGVSELVVLDGFEIRGGHANGASSSQRRGAAIQASQCTVTVRRCTVTDCYSELSSNVLLDTGSTSEFTDCLFSDNLAAYSAGVSARGVPGAIASFDGCTWARNEATIAEGAFSAIHEADVTISGSDFLDNRAVVGGTLRTEGLATLTLVECLVEGSRSSEGAGAIQTLGSSVLEIQGGAFVDNRSEGWDAGAIWAQGASTVRATGTEFLRNEAFFAGGAIQSSARLELRDCVFALNRAGSDGGALRIFDAGPGSGTGALIERCTFESNVADGLRGGAIASVSQSDLMVQSSRFTDNRAQTGGAIWMTGASADVLVLNCVFDANEATTAGAGLFVIGGAGRVVASSFAANIGPAGSAVHATTGSAFQIVSCAIEAADLPAIVVAEPATVRATCLPGGHPGVGNIDDVPGFRDPESGDFRLGPGSICIDSGDTDAIPADVEVDFLGGIRRLDDPSTPDAGFGGPPVVDMGAIEFDADACPADIDGDLEIGFSDLVILLGAWGPCPDCFMCSGDVAGDGDCVVGFDDLVTLLGAWGLCG